jgi:hypothetical protein
MIGHRASVGPWLLALALAACDPIHTIGKEDAVLDAGLDAGSDAGVDAGPRPDCSADGGCPCGFACAYSDDIKGPRCGVQTQSCGADGGPAGCADGGLCLTPIVAGAACAVSRCFAALGTTSCASDADCACGESCAAADGGGGGVCSTFATCTSGLDCRGGDCVEVYRNGLLCAGIRQCLDE